MATVLMHIQEPVPRPRSLNPDLPPAVEAVILKSLEKDPARRFSTSTRLAEAYKAAIAGAPLASLEQPTVLSMVAPSSGGAARPSFENRSLARQKRPSALMPILLGLAGSLILVGILLSPPVLGFVRGLFSPEATAGIPVLPTAGTPVTIPVITPTPPPAPAATPVHSLECPGLQLIDFRRENEAVSWIVDNDTDAPLRLLDLNGHGFEDNPLVSFSLGASSLWELPAGVTPGPESAFTIPGDDRSVVPSHSTRPLRLLFARADTSPGYTYDFFFDGGCTLSTSW
jgi:hypothetical protein